MGNAQNSISSPLCNRLHVRAQGFVPHKLVHGPSPVVVLSFKLDRRFDCPNGPPVHEPRMPGKLKLVEATMGKVIAHSLSLSEHDYSKPAEVVSNAGVTYLVPIVDVRFMPICQGTHLRRVGEGVYLFRSPTKDADKTAPQMYWRAQDLKIRRRSKQGGWEGHATRQDAKNNGREILKRKRKRERWREEKMPTLYAVTLTRY
ncbi:hypothetical protein B0H63DRAFT_246635 [Podospora didyma]|uniref:Uncharacterized protein n=1 Tax=Podospora didyma TaxID=330526 RepID=A0AAE0NCI5_9PEZI|nr:hypothetical protein B0H63DRAFT_246635 [Podospora didyma]